MQFDKRRGGRATTTANRRIRAESQGTGTVDRRQRTRPSVGDPSGSARRSVPDPDPSGEAEIASATAVNPLAGFPGLEPQMPMDPTAIIAQGGFFSGTPPFGMPEDRLADRLPTALEALNQALGTPLPGSTPDAVPAQTPPVRPVEAPQTSPGPSPAMGEAVEFWDLWIQHRDQLLKRSLRLMSGNMDDAQDALSDAMVKASLKFDECREQIANQRAWLARVVHNACIDHHRSHRRQAHYSEVMKEESKIHPTVAAPASPTPEEDALMAEAMRSLDAELIDLPEKLREPLVMRFVQDLSYDEIADKLSITNCAVRKRIQLARERLRRSGIR